MASNQSILINQLPQYEFDFEQIKREVLVLLEDYNFIPQIGLTHTTANLTEEEKILESTGSVRDYQSGKFRFKETDFSVFNEAFTHTYLHEVYQSIPHVGRFRIMTMNGPACYSIHKDLSKRHHYVIETNPDCLFLFPDFKEQIHLPCDKKLYTVNTLHRHTFVNGSRSRRIHLVFDDLSTLKDIGPI